MKKKVYSPGSATVVNAIATGCGSAFGIDIGIIAEAELSSQGVKCVPDLDVDTSLMDLCIKNVLKHYGVETGVVLTTISELPPASGLSSSSALSNAVTLATSQLIADEFDLNYMNDMEIINMAIDSSLQAGVTITGAFDDATASYFGGITVTNNLLRKIIIQEEMEKHKLLIYIPNIESMTAKSDVSRMKLLAPLVDIAFEKACQKQYFNALNLNGILYSSSLGFDTNIAIDALDAGAIASGLSGTGSAYVAIVDETSKDEVKDVWNSYSGKIIETSVNNDGTKII
ncbi:homoserine kinase [Methanobrevibacter cuticularis]|uniref:Shikimate kinase n=1 Tax=Methanobrevibacter cuticularis TaxID=47311 RepID=A0A166F789_9EURY|nr:shikimate kinase [Methanobrevibacter cuticularis]KZX17388.1 homoserine kinase [Methanobrevibacter cuticularis]